MAPVPFNSGVKDMAKTSAQRLARCLVLCTRERGRAAHRKDSISLRELDLLRVELTQLFEEQTSGRVIGIVLKDDAPVLDPRQLPSLLKEQAS